MPPVCINGIMVEFPFVPYPCQVDYMTKLIECLKQGVNGILESPTGTGKTLCLLCATLGWLHHMKAAVELKNIQGRQLLKDADQEEIYQDELMTKLADATGGWDGRPAAPKIIYASRTHSQLSQAMQELKKTQYSSVKASVLGSREQLCIHPQVSKESNNSTKVHMCRAKVSARTCHFYNNVDLMKHNFSGKINDIEDLTKLGEKHKCCPYYTTRELKQEADIIFMPYNYLLDPKSRRAHGVELPGNIVIFDEAHNLEKICEDSVSFDLTSHDLASAIEEMKELCTRMVELAKEEIDSQEMSELEDGSANVGCEFTLKQVMDIKTLLMKLETELDALNVPAKGLTKPGHFIFEFLERVGISFESKNNFLEVIDKILNHVTNEGSSRFLTKGHGISKIADIVKIIFSRDPQEAIFDTTKHRFQLAKCYKVHIAKEVQDKRKKRTDLWTSAQTSDKVGHTLSYWCFSPGHSMEDLTSHGVKSIILTSGTLSPIESFGLEMGIKFPITLQNPHIIQEHQMFVASVTKGPDSYKLNSNFENRGTPEYKATLGNAIVNFARAVPNGLLIFFPSYPVMTSCIEYWQQTNIFNRITQYKALLVEPRTKPEFHQTMETFYEKINDPTLNGAIFAAVCRGKVSEGLDFADINGRAVVITGLPFPPRMDPKIVLKMEYLDENKAKNRKGLLGREWYRQQASRAVNQAIGRVIRHKDDYGAVLLCDERFSSRDSKSQLPSWVQPHLKSFSTFGLVMRDLMQFFKAAEIALPSPVVKPRRTPVTLGCQGASFMPTEVRRSENQHVSAAGNVESHVASLRKCSSSSQSEISLTSQEEAQADSIARLSVQYEFTAPKKPATKGKKRGLLDALDTHTDKSFEDHKMASPKASSGQSLLERRMEQQRKNKKAVKIKDKSSTGSEVKSAAMDYVHKVKTVLSTDSYKIFHRAMIDYAAKANFDSLISTLAALFTEDLNKTDLFRGFFQYVKQQHKEKFCKICVDITGCAPAGSEESKPGPSSRNTDPNPEKRRKLNEPSIGKFADVKSAKIPAATSCGYQSEVLKNAQSGSMGVWSAASSKTDDADSGILDKLFGRDFVDGVSKSASRQEENNVPTFSVQNNSSVPSNSTCSTQSVISNLTMSSNARTENKASTGGGKSKPVEISQEKVSSNVGHQPIVDHRGNTLTSNSSVKENGASNMLNFFSKRKNEGSGGSVTCSAGQVTLNSSKGESKSDLKNRSRGCDNDKKCSVMSRIHVADSDQGSNSGTTKSTSQSVKQTKTPQPVSSNETEEKPQRKYDKNGNIKTVNRGTMDQVDGSASSAGQPKPSVVKEDISPSERDQSSKTDISTPDSVTAPVCFKCHKTVTAPLKAQMCGHICCFPCWKSILLDTSGGSSKVCPECGAVVRRKDLVKVKLDR